MAASKTNGISGGERRRKPRAGAAVAAVATNEGAWLGRVDALAELLSGVDDRSEIVNHVVSETMNLLPADQVVFRADATTVSAPSFTEENQDGAARAIIPLAVAGRHFGAIEIAMKPKRAVGPAERTLSIALARQGALALDNLAMRKAQPQTTPRDNVPPLEPAPREAAPPETTTPGQSVMAVPAGPARDLAAVQAALVRLESDLRGLAKLARSADLPPTSWVTEAERNALRHLEDLRARLLGPADAA